MELNDKKFAVLIDADNISHRKIKDILDEIANYGTPTIKRIYGDFTNPKFAAWKEVLLENSITPIQQYAYTTGKNATDSALIIDAMDILHKEGVNGFCIVSSDSEIWLAHCSSPSTAGRCVWSMGSCEGRNMSHISPKVNSGLNSPPPWRRPYGVVTAQHQARKRFILCSRMGMLRSSLSVSMARCTFFCFSFSVSTSISLFIEPSALRKKPMVSIPHITSIAVRACAPPCAGV